MGPTPDLSGRRGCRVSSSDRATLPRRTPRTNGSTSTRYASPPTSITRSPPTWAVERRSRNPVCLVPPAATSTPPAAGALSPPGRRAFPPSLDIRVVTGAVVTGDGRRGVYPPGLSAEAGDRDDFRRPQ